MSVRESRRLFGVGAVFHVTNSSCQVSSSTEYTKAALGAPFERSLQCRFNVAERTLPLVALKSKRVSICLS
jgi:hypothetical protein